MCEKNVVERLMRELKWAIREEEADIKRTDGQGLTHANIYYRGRRDGLQFALKLISVLTTEGGQ